MSVRFNLQKQNAESDGGKSLMRKLGPTGNPQASNLFAVIYYLQEQESIYLEVKARKVA